MSDKTLNECNDKYDSKSINTDKPSGYCSTDNLGQPFGSQKDLVEPDSFTSSPKRSGLGHEAQCDPIQRSGWGDELREDLSYETINRYSQVLRGADEAMKELFDDITVTDDNGKEHKIPIVVAPPEKAVAFIIQDNVRKDATFVVDRIRLPILSLYQSDISPDNDRFMYQKRVNYFRDEDGKPGWTAPNRGKERGTIFGKAWGIPVNISYQLNAWTMYKEDMNQIIQQIHLKFSPVAYIKIQDVNYETIVKHDSTSNNQEAQPGDKNVRVLKYQFNLTVQTYIPQPIIRKKAVLAIKADLVDYIGDDVIDVLKKIEIDVKEDNV